MIRMIGGRQVDIPEEADGSVDVQRLRSEIGIPQGRMLIVQLPGGQNHLLPPKGRAMIPEYAHLMDAPKIVRG